AIEACAFAFLGHHIFDSLLCLLAPSREGVDQSLVQVDERLVWTELHCRVNHLLGSAEFALHHVGFCETRVYPGMVRSVLSHLSKYLQGLSRFLLGFVHRW